MPPDSFREEEEEKKKKDLVLVRWKTISLFIFPSSDCSFEEMVSFRF